jgi:hypothetical protein
LNAEQNEQNPEQVSILLMIHPPGL